MGFWPFGRDNERVELSSRIISATTRNGCRVRGKVTVHFLEAQAPDDANVAMDRCAERATALLGDLRDQGQVIGAEIALGSELLARYPTEVARARAVEFAAFHVLGDPALSDELRRASSLAPGMVPVLGGNTPSSPPVDAPIRFPAPARVPTNAPTSPGAASRKPSSAPPPNAVIPAAAASVLRASNAASGASSSPPPAPGSSAPPPLSSRPPGPAGPAKEGMPPRRRGSSRQLRSVQALLLPPGTPPSGMAAFLAPVVRDAATRVLIGYLRSHDLVTVRGVVIDENSVEMLDGLVAVSDAPLGGFEASRAAEISRWQTTLGPKVMAALQREVKAITLHLTRMGFDAVAVMPALTEAVLKATAAAAFPNDEDLLSDANRYPRSHLTEILPVAARNLARIPNNEDDPTAIGLALAPALAAALDDVATGAMVIKASSGT